MIPITMLATHKVSVGDTVNLNQYIREIGKTVTRIYKVMTVDRINELVGCVCVGETEFRV